MQYERRRIMHKGSLNSSIKELKKLYDKGRLSFDSSIQRATNQWSAEQKSEFIHSLFAKYYVPSLCFSETIVVEAGKNVTYYDVLDGKQRLSVVFEFMNDEFKLKKGTPSFVDDKGDTIELEGLKFSKMSVDLQKELENTQLSITTLKELEREERELMFYRLNNGSPLSMVQKTRSIMGEELSGFLNAILKKDFFNVCNVTKTQTKKEDLLLCLVQGIMLNDTTYTWDNINAGRVANYCAYLKDNFPIEMQAKVIDAIDFLGEVFSKDNIDEMGSENVKKGKVVFLKKINIPIVINEAMRLCEYKIDTKLVSMFFDDFFEPTSKAQVVYQTYCKDATTSKYKVCGRMECLKDGVDKNAFFELKDEDKYETSTLKDAKDELAKSGDTILTKNFILK